MKLTQKQLAKLRADYLSKREELLQKRVSALSLKMWDKIYNRYLVALENTEGKLILNERNINMIAGLDSVYKAFNMADNLPVIKGFVSDLEKIVPLNERYFKNIAQKEISATTENADRIVRRRLGILKDGTPIQDGFVEKFISDQKLIKQIKRQSIQALTKGKSFVDFRTELKATITGAPGVPNSGGVHQYYRNYAYDTFQQVDRLAGKNFAKELSLRCFIWQGGLIQTSRPLCQKLNGAIIDSEEFKNLEYDDLKEKYQPGVPDPWNPMLDLGGYGCRHSIDWIADSVAEKYPAKKVSINVILK